VAKQAGFSKQVQALVSNGKPTQTPLAKQGLSYFLGKCVVITGASSGIGRSLAFWYLNNGARVALVGRDVEELDAVARQFPSTALVCVCDLTVDW
jgi:NADP-dependent 3-hydroxy acid dehydrogenase YdfG